MVILSVHNYYQQPGGEDGVVASEASLLRSRGHEVVQHSEYNDRIHGMSRLRVGLRTVWSREGYRQTRSSLRRVRPAIMHVHNSFPLLSPAIYYAAKAEGVAVVQTLHNYRLLCPNAQLFRGGRVCEDCVGKPLPSAGVRHACYRGSRAGSAAVAAMITAHRALATWHRMVDIYVALTEFGRQKFVSGGLPPDRIAVKPNFVAPDPGVRAGSGEHALFIGRLSPEKGIWTLLRAWRRGVEIPLHIVGDGPLLPEIARFVRENDLEGLVHLVGRVPRAEVVGHLHRARFLVFPSEWYEGLPGVIIEAFACGVPVVASELGAAGEIVVDGWSGLHFRVGDPEDLARKARSLAADPNRCLELGRRARAEYETRYSADVNYPLLMQVYETALARRHSARTAAGEPSPVPIHHG